MDSFQGNTWNYVFVGCNGAPDSHCSNTGGSPDTTIESSHMIAEKPYIISDDGWFKLMRPKYEQSKKGSSKANGWENADEIDFSKVYVASSADSASDINEKLSHGLHIVFQPGIYDLEETLVVEKPNTVLLGIGIATLVA
jgi:hypothetical protein